MTDNDKKAAIAVLNRIMEAELAGVVRYTHYALMVYGYNRIPIVSWLEGNASEGLVHARKAGELVTLLGGTRRSRLDRFWRRPDTISAISCAKAWNMKS